MTKSPYNPEKFNELAHRLLQLAGRITSLGETLRQEELTALELHDRKAREWLAKLEDWSDSAAARVKREQFKARGARRARDFSG